MIVANRSSNRTPGVFLVLLFAGSAFAQPKIASCPAYPPNNVWNAAVDSLPVHPQNAAYQAKIGPPAGLRIDDVMPINITSGAKYKIHIGGIATPESDPGTYVVPPNPHVEPGTDSHLLVVDTDDCILYELYLAKPGGGGWTAGSGAKWDLNSNAIRPDGWTSADAAGLPIAPGVLRYEEVAAGAVTHALRFSVPYTQGNGVYQWPARHYASHHPDGPPMGARFRLRAGFDISGFPAALQVILRGLKKYGAILADNGMPWGFQHDQDPRWNRDELLALHKVLGSNMEAVDIASLMVDPNSAITGAAGGMIMASDLLGRMNGVRLGPGLGIVNGVLVLKH